jgi:flavin-dependent dehydrogenase
MRSKPKTITILGGGPSGCALGILLKRSGYRVAVFYLDKRPEIIVGESLVPAVIPMLKALGVEDEVKSYSTYKPGASVWLNADEEATAPFSAGQGKIPPYAYNVPRVKFDKTIFEKAQREGVQLFNHVARIERTGNGDELMLAEETIRFCGDYFNGQPDLIVDCSGRARAVSRLLDIPTKTGQRKDVALFAHLSGAKKIDPYNIHLHRLEKGWCWRIPLPGLTSVGVVINPAHIAGYGNTIEEQYDNFLLRDETLRKFTSGAKRETAVVKYSNYQLISQKMSGRNWVLTGDAGGFLDPIFSTGLFLALKGAFRLVRAIDEDGATDAAFTKYGREQQWELEVWERVVETWYNGRLFTLFRVGEDRMHTSFGKFIAPHMIKYLTRIFTGEAVYTRYSRYFLRFVTGSLIDLMKFAGLHKRDVNDLKVN